MFWRVIDVNFDRREKKIHANFPDFQRPNPAPPTKFFQ
jgi:hypothetical protein